MARARPDGYALMFGTAATHGINAALEAPTIRQRLTDAGNTPRHESVEQFRATVKANRAQWAEVVRASGATID